MNVCQRPMKRARNFECHPSNCTPVLLHNKWFGYTLDDLARPKITPLILSVQNMMKLTEFRQYVACSSLCTFIAVVK